MLLNENLFEDMLEPDDIVQVDVIDDQPVLEGPESGEEMGIANMLTDAISNTWNSVNEVNDLIANLSDEHKDFEDSLDKINADNMENIGVLQGLLSQVSPNVDNIKDGEMEVQQDLGESMDEEKILDKKLDTPSDWAEFAKNYFKNHQWLMKELAK